MASLMLLSALKPRLLFNISVSLTQWSNRELSDVARRRRVYLRRTKKNRRQLESKERADAEAKFSDLINVKQVDIDVQTLGTRGFLRNTKSYLPEQNVKDKVIHLARQVFLDRKVDNLESATLDDRVEKFKVLTKCIKEFDHDIPTSQLHKLKTIGDVISYYQSPVKTTTPFEDLLQRDDLPTNLHIQPNYVRFDPESDTRFGINAFPGRPTKIISLKAKKLGLKSYDTRPVARQMIDEINSLVKR